MYRNNNKAAVKRLSVRSLKANRKRNVIALIAIVLTTFMITTVFSIGMSFAKNMSVMMVRLSGTEASIFLKQPVEGQKEKISAIDGVKAVGTEIVCGSVKMKTADGKDMSITLLNYDDIDWKYNILPAIGEIKGQYPTAVNEVMLSQRALKQLGVENAQSGDAVSLTYKCNGNVYSEDFIISGVFAEYESTQTSGLCLMSQAFCTEKSLSAQANGQLALSITGSAKYDIYDKIDNEIKQENQKLSSSFTADSESVTSTTMAVAAIVIVALFIVLSGYLLIYNIMYISVTKDIHFYGLLKTIGTSPKQLRAIVMRQAMLLSGIGIPSGLLLGFLVSFKLVPVALLSLSSDSGSAMPADMSFNPLIFIGTALFALLTVVISCRKPGRIAAGVSPIEAVKFSGASQKLKKTQRKSKGGNRVSAMAFHNVFRDKKRAVLVFVSLFLGCVTFLCVYSLFESIDVDNYIAEYHSNDFQYQSIPPLGEVKFDNDFLEQVGQLEGIDDKEIVRLEYCTIPFDEELLRPVLEYTYEHEIKAVEKDATYEDLLFSMRNMEKNIGYGTGVYSIGEEYIEKYNKTHKDKIDIESFRRGEVCLIGHGGYTKMTGRTLNLTSKTYGVEKKVKIGGVLDNGDTVDFAKYGYAVGSIQGVYVSEEFMASINPDATVVFININAKEGYEPSVRASLEKLNATLTNSAFSYSSKRDVADQFSSTMTTMTVLTSGMSALLILIGIINFFNVMMTGVYSRRRELAVLESIGMTKSQINRMLTAEGSYYAVITSFLVLTLGSFAMIALSKAIPGLVDYAAFNYPWKIVLLLIVAIFAVCLCVPSIVYKTTAKESVTERLKTIDS